MLQRKPERHLARQCILAALDEAVAQLTFQAAQFQEKDTAAPILVTPEVTDWIDRIHWALVRYAEGEYVEAVRLADITGTGEDFERWLSHSSPR